MPLLVNLRHLEAHNVELEGELSLEELDIETRDEMIRLSGPLQYAIEVQKIEEALLVTGKLKLALDCQCVRCLKGFRQVLRLDGWTVHVPLQGDEAVPIVNDCVDLTPLVREDILLEFPQHPLCDPECGGLPEKVKSRAKKTSGTGKPGEGSSAWSELNKLKF